MPDTRSPDHTHATVKPLYAVRAIVERADEARRTGDISSAIRAIEEAYAAYDAILNAEGQHNE